MSLQSASRRAECAVGRAFRRESTASLKHINQHTKSPVKPTRALLALGTSALCVVAATAQTKDAKPCDPPPGASLDKALHSAKQPTSWMKLSFDARLRNEYYNNDSTLNGDAQYHEQNYQRYRLRLGTVITPVKDLDINARATWEPRTWNKGTGRGGVGNGRDNPGTGLHGTGTGMDWQEGIIDILSVKYSNIGGSPVTMNVGRQEIQDLGHGWLIFDGTPLDGSRTHFFDAARLTLNLKESKTKVDVIALDQRAMNDYWIPTIQNLDKQLANENMRGLVLWGANRSMDYLGVDVYGIYTHMDNLNHSQVGYNNGTSGDLFTFGGRLSGTVQEHFTYRVEGAGQFGEKRDPLLRDNYAKAKGLEKRDQLAFGANGQVSYLFKDSMNTQVRVSYEYCSGDDGSTKKDEAFDILWGRYPQWSDIMVFSSGPEWRNAQYGNLHRIGPGFSISPTKKLNFAADYYFLFADQSETTRASARNAALFSQTSYDRGSMATAVIKYTHNQHLSARLMGELLFPGDFYAYSDTISFVRAEVVVAW